MTAPHYLLLFAKYPYHGKVKTRLEPALGVDNAQIFARTALIEVLQYFGRLSREKAGNDGKICCKCIWCFAPSSAADDVQQLLKEHNLDTTWQAWPQLDSTSNLGHRLAASVTRAQKEGEQEEEQRNEETTNNANPKRATCTLIGSDCFQLTTSHVKSSIQAASSNDSSAVLLPANDGGYVLLSIPIPIAAVDSIFDNIRWSSAETASDQRGQLEKGGLTVKIGDTLSDVDEPADLQHLLDLSESQDGDHIKTAYPRTIAFVQEHMKRIQG